MDELKYSKPIKKAKYHLKYIYNYSRINPIQKQFASNHVNPVAFDQMYSKIFRCI